MGHYKPDMGRFIVQEQFRQYKIFVYALENKNLALWFDYMDKFDQNCDEDWINSEACSQKIRNSLAIGKLKNMDEF